MTSLLEKIKKPITNGMSILTLIAFFGFNLIGKVLVDVFDINQTMGWKFSILYSWIDYIPIFSILIFFGVYLILNLLKVKTNLILSTLHLLLIALSAFLYNFWEMDIRIILFIICFSIITFAINIFKTISNKNVLQQRV